MNWFPFKLFKVKGDSMKPLYKSGDYLLIRKGKVKQGDFILFKHDSRYKVKELVSIETSGYFVLGKNLRVSTDSRHFGLVDPSTVVGKVILKI